MASERPNVLWILTDEQRRDSLGLYCSPWAHTPNLDRIAAEGVVFGNAVTPAPVCSPARCSMVTGLRAAQTRVWTNLTGDYPEGDHLTYAFRDAGYRTASVGKSHYCTSSKAFEQDNLGQVTTRHVQYYNYADEYNEADYDVLKYPGQPYPWIFGGRFPADESETAEAQCIEAAKAWLSENEGDDPFFLCISLNAPHTPVAPPRPFDRIIDESLIALPPGAEANSPGEPDWIRSHLRQAADANIMSAEQIRKMRRYYYGWAAHVDNQLGRLLTAMRETGRLDNTIIAFVSDHGTHLGDFGLVQKQTFFEPVATVPFFFWWPGHLAEGARIDEPVETRSLLPTLADLAGISIDSARAEIGVADSLRTGREPERRLCFSEFTLASFDTIGHTDPIVMVRDGDFKLSLCFAPEASDGTLVNLADDPHERVNLYGDPAHADTRDRLQRAVVEHFDSREDVSFS